MPIISQFYGIIIKIYFKEGERHHKEHVHINYNEYEAVYDMQGNVISGNLLKKQRKMLEAWIIIHEIELRALWKEIKESGEYFKIDPLR